MSIKTAMLTASFLAAGLLTAAAQSTTSPPARSPSSPGTMQNQPMSPGSNTNASVSASTHCKTASGQVHLKGTTGSAPGTPIQGVSPSIVATLPNC